MKNKKLILFDYDGTIADTQESIILGIKHAFSKYKIKIPETKVLKENIGRSLLPFFKEMTGNNDEKFLNNLILAYRESYFKEQSSGKLNDSIFPYVIETLNELYQQGYLLGIATNKSKNGLIEGLKRHKIVEFFSVIKTVNDCKPKPDPEMGEVALKELGVSKENSVMIGDTINDALMAKKCGIKFIGVKWGNNSDKILIENGAIFILKTFKQLPEKIYYLLK